MVRDEREKGKIRLTNELGDLAERGFPRESTTEIMKLWESGAFEVIGETPAEVANKRWEFAGLDRPPYDSEAPVFQLRLKQDIKLIRYYDGDISRLYGNWAMIETDTAGLNMTQIKDKFALPEIPTKMCEVYLKAGDVIEISVAGRLDWGSGGGMQIDLLNNYIGTFKEIQ